MTGQTKQIKQAKQAKQDKQDKQDKQAKQPSTSSQSDKREDIALAAYYRAQMRGFEPGGDMGDWLEAEREIRGAGAEQP